MFFSDMRNINSHRPIHKTFTKNAALILPIIHSIGKIQTEEHFIICWTLKGFSHHYRLIVIGVLYFGGGSFYNHVNGARGIELLPHHWFWTNLTGYVIVSTHVSTVIQYYELPRCFIY